jgi:hypothetical protein
MDSGLGHDMVGEGSHQTNPPERGSGKLGCLHAKDKGDNVDFALPEHYGLMSETINIARGFSRPLSTARHPPSRAGLRAPSQL